MFRMNRNAFRLSALCGLCALCGSFFFFVPPFRAFAEPEWVFLPPSPLFRPLIADPREPQIGLLGHLDTARYEGEVGGFVELLRYSPKDGTRWGWGILGSAFILLDENGATFPMRAGDWYAGTYLSEVTGPLSHRLEFVHQSAHLGDSLQGLQNPFFFSRENFNYTFSFAPSRDFRLHAGLGVWENMYPSGPPLFASLGAEFYSSPFHPAGSWMRGYFTCDFQWKQETEIVDKTFQLGLQWKSQEEETRALRLALLYYNGDSEYGQIYRDWDEHWSLALFFDY